MFKIFRYFFTCLSIIIFLFLLILIALALSGVKIPYLSAFLYKEPPKLERPIYASKENGQQKLAQIIEGQTLILDESDFSSFLSAGFSAKSQSVKSVKTNIYNNKINAMIVLGKNNDYYLSLELKPIENSSKLEIKKAAIGYLPIPVFLARYILGTGNEFDLSNIFKTYGLKVENINLSDREIEIKFAKL